MRCATPRLATPLTSAMIAIGSLAGGAGADQEYVFTLVDAFATDYGLRECYIYDINEVNRACGTATIKIPWLGGWMITYTGFYWDPVTGKTPIDSSWPHGISDPGQVAGVSAIFDIPTGTSLPMPLLPGTYLPLALHGINDDGIAVGYVQICNCSNSSGMLQIPYVWSPKTGGFSLPVPGATGASRINNQGRIVGWIGGNAAPNSYVYDLSTETFTIMSSVFPGPNTKTTATDVNELGVVVGARMSANGQVSYGYTWSEETGVTMLPLPPSGYQPYVSPSGINSAGTIVGAIFTPTASSRAFVYDDVHGIRDLHTLTTPSPGFTMMTATAINDNGWIVGYGYGGGGMYKSFVLKPVVVGDLDGDGLVSAPDLAILLASWGPAGSNGQGADLDGDGTIGPADLSILLAAWSTGSG